MTVKIKSFPTPGDVARAAANLFIERVGAALEKNSAVHVALTGGTVGIASLVELGGHPNRDSIDYKRVHIWWGDERFVSGDSRDRNSLLAREALLEKIEIPAANIHEFPAKSDSLNLNEATAEFSETVRLHAGDDGLIPFDLVFLGMGPDGHVASLFPGQKIESGNESVIAVPDSPKPPAERVSFTFRALNRAKEVVFVVAGVDKAAALADAFGNDDSDLPAAKVRGQNSSVLLADDAALSLLS